MQQFHASVVIVGAGIAGLWLLNLLRQQGVNAVLLEQTAIGGGQTITAQGIIHGGAKYALTGKISTAANSVAQMTAVWAECLAGRGPIDLSQVKLLSDAHYLWSLSRLTGGIKSFVSAKMLHSDAQILKTHEYPQALQHRQCKGSICRLQERVLDVPSLLQALTLPHLAAIWQADASSQYQYDHDGVLEAIHLKAAGNTMHLTADHYIFTAGAGNEALLPNQTLKGEEHMMQRRPLHMVWLKFPKSCPEYVLYLHCVTSGVVPRLTITTHQDAQGKTVWYLGGGLAESGINRNTTEQIKAAQQEIAALLPWIDVTGAEWHTFMIDRAEQENGGKRPDAPGIYHHQNWWVSWPTKLTLAPALAVTLLAQLRLLSTPQQPLPVWPAPPFAKPVWD